MSYLLNSLLSSQQRAQADAADAAMLNLNGLRAERALLHIAAQAIDASQRPGFDADYGSYTQNPADPRHVADEEVGDMLEAINCAEQSLHMARQALEGYGNKVSTLTARSLFNEAREYLEVPQ